MDYKKSIKYLFFFSLGLALLLPIYDIILAIINFNAKGPGWSFFPISIIFSLIFSTLISTYIFIIGLPLIILVFAIKERLNGNFEKSGMKKWWVILSAIFFIFIISLSIIIPGYTSYRTNLINEVENLQDQEEILKLIDSTKIKIDTKIVSTIGSEGTSLTIAILILPIDSIFEMSCHRGNSCDDPTMIDKFYQSITRPALALLVSKTNNPQILREMSNSIELVKNEVARNPNTPEDILYKLFEEKSKYCSYCGEHRTYRSYLLNNTKTPADILQTIYEEDSANNQLYLSVSGLCKHPNTPQSVIMEIRKQNSNC